MKASFAQFLSLRHGGSGFVFGYGSGATGQNTTVVTGNPNAPAAPNNAIPADRPFHSLSYPDINYTVMRPSALPPSAYSDPPTVAPPPAVTWPPTYAGGYVGDPGVRNPSLYQGFPTNLNAGILPNKYTLGSVPQSTPATRALAAGHPGAPLVPAAGRDSEPDHRPVSNAGETGDTYINNTTPATASVATGGLPPYLVPDGNSYNVNDSVVNLFWVPSGTAPQPPAMPATPNPYLGVNSSLRGTRPGHRHQAEPLLPHRDVAEGA